jgi:hypothetical protein
MTREPLPHWVWKLIRNANFGDGGDGGDGGGDGGAGGEADSGDSSSAAASTDASAPASDSGAPATDASAPSADAGTPADTSQATAGGPADTGTPSSDSGTPSSDAGTPSTPADTTAGAGATPAGTDAGGAPPSATGGDVSSQAPGSTLPGGLGDLSGIAPIGTVGAAAPAVGGAPGAGLGVGGPGALGPGTFGFAGSDPATLGISAPAVTPALPNPGIFQNDFGAFANPTAPPTAESSLSALPTGFIGPAPSAALALDTGATPFGTGPLVGGAQNVNVPGGGFDPGAYSGTVPQGVSSPGTDFSGGQNALGGAAPTAIDVGGLGTGPGQPGVDVAPTSQEYINQEFNALPAAPALPAATPTDIAQNAAGNTPASPAGPVSSILPAGTGPGPTDTIGGTNIQQTTGNINLGGQQPAIQQPAAGTGGTGSGTGGPPAGTGDPAAGGPTGTGAAGDTGIAGLDAAAGGFSSLSAGGGGPLGGDTPATTALQTPGLADTGGLGPTVPPGPTGPTYPGLLGGVTADELTRLGLDPNVFAENQQATLTYLEGNGYPATPQTISLVNQMLLGNLQQLFRTPGQQLFA